MSKFGRFWACPERRHLALPQSSPCHWLWLPCKCLPLSLLPLTALDQRWWGIFGHGRMMQMDPLSPLSPGDCHDTPTHPPQWGGAPPQPGFPVQPCPGCLFWPQPREFFVSPVSVQRCSSHLTNQQCLGVLFSHGCFFICIFTKILPSYVVPDAILL